jgi:hypothetical protein
MSTRRLNVRGGTHVRSRRRLGRSDRDRGRLGDGRAANGTFPLRRDAFGEHALSDGDAPGGEPRRHDRAHQYKDGAASIDAPDRERGDQACGAGPSRAPDGGARGARDDSGSAPRAPDDLASRTPRTGRRKIIEARRLLDRLGRFRGRGGEEAFLDLGPRRVIGGLRDISHKGLEPRARKGLGAARPHSLRSVPGRARIPAAPPPSIAGCRESCRADRPPGRASARNQPGPCRRSARALPARCSRW